MTGHRWLGVYMAHETILNVLVLGPFFVLGPVIAAARLGGAPAWSAIALGYVIGSLLAANITFRWAPRRPVLAGIAVTLLLVLMPALFGLPAPIWLIVPAALLAGVESTICNTLVTAALQANLPERTLGRVNAIAGIGSTVLVPVGMGLAGVVAGAVGTEAVMLGGAAVALTTTAACISLPSTHIRLRLSSAGTDRS